MINHKRSFDVKNGVIIKGNGTNRVGIHYGDLTPDLEDDGMINKGSIYIRTNGELWQKTGTLATSWVLNSSVAGTGGGAAVPSISQYSYTFNRSGDVEQETWLKLGKVSSNEASIVAQAAITKVMLSGSTEKASNGIIRIYVKKAGTWTAGYDALTFANQRLVSSPIVTLTSPILAGEEVAIKCDLGNFENLVVTMRLIE